MPDDSVAVAVVKAAPPVIITSITTLFGFTLNEWVAITTIIYVVLQSVFLVSDRLKKRRNKRRIDDQK